nr:MAG TPA: Helix-turn-helix XRE-family like protein [Caudoviricetes sp.]
MWDIIETYLKKRNMTIYQVSKEAGLSKGYLYNYKNGNAEGMPLQNVCKVAIVLDIDMNEFKEVVNDEIN